MLNFYTSSHTRVVDVSRIQVKGCCPHQSPHGHLSHQRPSPVWPANSSTHGKHHHLPLHSIQAPRKKCRGSCIVKASSKTADSNARQQLTQVSADELEVHQENLPGAAVKLTITVPPKVCKRCYNSALKQMRKFVGTVKGFPANQPLPEAVVAAKIGGERNYRMTVVEEVLMSTYEVVMSRYRSVAIDGSDKVLSRASDLAANFNVHSPMVYEISFDMIPSVKWRAPYTSLAITIQDSGNEETDRAAAEDLIRQYLKEKGSQRVVHTRGLEKSDVALIDMEIRQAGDNKPLPGLKKEMFVLDTEADPLGLTNHMQGMKQGEERNFQFVFPDDWHMELWQGMPAEGRVKLHELFSWALPEFDDAFVAKHYPQFPSADVMRQTLIQQTARERFEQRDRDIREAFFEELVKIVDVDVPEPLVLEAGEQEYMGRLMEMVAQGQARPEQLESMATEELLDKYIANSRQKLEDLVKLQLGCEEIFKAEGLQVDEQQLMAEIKAAVEDFNARKMDYDLDKIREQALEGLKAVAIMDWLKDNCNVTIKPWSASTASTA